MTRTIARTAVCLVALPLAAVAASQALLALRTRVENAVASQTPEWTLSASNLEGSGFEQSWSHGLESLRIRCAEHASNAAAAEALDAVMLQAAGGQKVGDIGDAARIWPNWAVDGQSTIYFRRAIFLCGTSAPSVGLTKRFSALVVREIDGLQAGAKAPAPVGKDTLAADYRVSIVLVGLDPFALEVPVGARVTFVNKDGRFAHDIASQCPEIDAVGRLEPGESARTAPFTSAKTCSYYDRLHPDTPLRRGKIVVR